MTKKILTAFLLLAFLAPIACAKQDLSSQKSKLMPVISSPQMAGYEGMKKALEEPRGAAVLKKMISDLIERALSDVKKLKKEHKPKKQKPAYDPTMPPPPQGVIHMEPPQSMDVMVIGDTVQANYSYDTSQGAVYDKVTMVYDAVTGEALSATGYVHTQLLEVPDLTGMTLTFTAYRADRTLAYQTYQNEPNATGAYTIIKLEYQPDGIKPITQIFVQPFDPAMVRTP